MPAEQVPAPEGGRPRPSNSDAGLDAGHRRRRRETARANEAATVGCVPLLLADVGVGGLTPGGATRHCLAAAGGVPPPQVLAPVPRPAPIAGPCPRCGPPVVGRVVVARRVASIAALPDPPAARRGVAVHDCATRIPAGGRAGAGRARHAVGPPPAGPAAPCRVTGVLPARSAGGPVPRTTRRGVATPRRSPVPSVPEKPVLLVNECAAAPGLSTAVRSAPPVTAADLVLLAAEESFGRDLLPLGRNHHGLDSLAEVPISLAGRLVAGAAHLHDLARHPPKEELAEAGVVGHAARHHLPDRGRAVAREPRRELLAHQRPPGPSDVRPPCMLPPWRTFAPRSPRPSPTVAAGEPTSLRPPS